MIKLKVVFFYFLEVLVCADLQLVSSHFVADDDAMLVKLQSTDGSCLGNRSLNGSLERT